MGRVRCNTIENILCRLIIQESGCFAWPGKLNDKGYARIRYQGRMAYLHLILYAHFRGSIPTGLEADHLCRNRACVNPWHIETVTHRENVLRGCAPTAQFARQTHCKRGHAFTPSNTRIRKHDGGRECRECARQAGRQLYWKQKGMGLRKGRPVGHAKA